MKGKYFSIFTLNKFNFGDRVIYQFVVFECKFLFSLIFFYFVKTEKIQDRYHTHAFNAISFKLFGSYDEHVLLDEKTGENITTKRTQFLKYFPRDSYHLIGRSEKGCLTFLISGPWKPTWKEWIEGEVTYYNWNRKTVNYEDTIRNKK